MNKEIVQTHKINFYKQEVDRALLYGYEYITNKEYRKKIINKIKNRKIREKRIKKVGQKEVNRYHNYLSSCRRRIFGDRKEGYCKNCIKIKPKNELTIDHIVPVAFGGKSEKSNMQVLCRDCHRLKTIQDIKQLSPIIHCNTI